MNPARLLAHFDRLCDAPDTIARLRCFILNLAVRGKLVEQDPKDEPAVALLQRIELQRADLVKKGEIKKDEPAQRMGEEELLFQAPAAWTWARFAQVASIQSNLVKPDAFPNHPHIAPDNIEGRTGKLLPYQTIRDSKVFSAKHLFFPGHIVYSKIRPNLAKAALVDFQGLCSADMYPIRSFIDPRFLLTFMLSEPFVQQSVKEANRVAMPKINQECLSRIAVLVPPLNEQHRIVAKVDELMALCDRLEAAQKERESRRDRLAAASLNRLNQPTDPDAFREHAHFHLQHLLRLATRPEHIQQLRQTILNLAVRGKLVPQNPDDASAAEFLGQRRVEVDVPPWPLPIGWEWSTLRNLGVTFGGGTPSKAESSYWNGPIPWVSPKDMKTDWIADAEDHISEAAIEVSSARLIPSGAILMVVRGMILSHSFPTAVSQVPLAINQDMKALLPFRADFAPMLLMLTKGLKPVILELVKRSTHGTCKLLTDELFSLLIPVPPLAEQHRIIAKVEELLALCHRLEEQLATAQTENRRLLGAVLHEALVSAR